MTDLSTVLEAARKWADELTNYIEPDARKQGSDADAEGYESEADKVYAAIQALEEDADPDGVVLEEGELEWTLDLESSKHDCVLQVDGHDVFSVRDVGEDGSAHVTVWATSHPDSVVLFEGTVNVRERRRGGDE